MSHFNVLVVGPDIESQLAPYMENCCETPDKKYMTFHEDEDCEPDPETGKRGYWQNDGAKWDWFVVGGRWAGYFLLKPGNVGPEPNVPLNPFSKELTRQALEHFAPKLDGRHTDQARKGEIDFETMRRRAEESAGATWDCVQKAIEGTPESQTWDTIRDATGDIDRARETYNSQPRVVAFQAFKNSEKGRQLIGIFDKVEEFTAPRQAQVEAARRSAITSFAVVKDSKWFERGSMGWWGMVHNEKDTETWDSQFTNLLDGLPDDTLLTIVDCHI